MIDPLVTSLALLGSAVAGLLVGSFLNVVIYRVPRGESIVRPRSHCPSCGHQIRARDNVPVASWLLLGRRCRDCRTPIPARYPLIELLTAGTWVAVTWWSVADPERLGLLPLLLVLGSAGVALAAIDLDHHRLPNAIVLPLYPVTAVGLALAGVWQGTWPLASTAVGALAWLVVIGGLWLATRGGGMGAGDVKLAPILGATLGWVSLGSALSGLLAGFVMGAVVGLTLLATGRAKRGSAIAFGPFLLIGAAIGLAVGDRLSAAYLRLAGLG